MTTTDTTLAALLAGLDQHGRCPVTELIISQCAHCRPAPASSRQRDLGPWFPANYRGACSDCGSHFDEGDRIRSDGTGGWLGNCCGNIDPQPAPTLDGLLAPAQPASVARQPRPCDDPFCNKYPDGRWCGWPPADHVGRPDGGRALLATTSTPTPTTRPETPPPSTVAEMREVLTQLDASRPRSQQVALGPSELGTPCQRQIAMKLAGVPRQLPDARPPWAPMQGTAMHELMAEALEHHNRALGRQRWIVEERLTIHPGAGSDDPGIHGHGDAYDTDSGMVVDWKYVGTTALREVKRKTIPNAELVKRDYRVQAHLYGYGHARAGRDVRWVRLVFLARSHDYDDSAEWTEAYDERIAVWAIDRYYATHDLITQLDLTANPGLWPVVPAAPGKPCDWCEFRRPGGPADQTGCPGDLDRKVEKQTAGIIA